MRISCVEERHRQGGVAAGLSRMIWVSVPASDPAPRLGVDDAHVRARADLLGQLFERDVAALVGVVEPAVRVLLDHAVGMSRCSIPSPGSRALGKAPFAAVATCSLTECLGRSYPSARPLWCTATRSCPLGCSPASACWLASRAEFGRRRDSRRVHARARSARPAPATPDAASPRRVARAATAGRRRSGAARARRARRRGRRARLRARERRRRRCSGGSTCCAPNHDGTIERTRCRSPPGSTRSSRSGATRRRHRRRRAARRQPRSGISRRALSGDHLGARRDPAARAASGSPPSFPGATYAARALRHRAICSASSRSAPTRCSCAAWCRRRDGLDADRAHLRAAGDGASIPADRGQDLEHDRRP